jgi:mono/diheme cytochrome c family protein
MMILSRFALFAVVILGFPVTAAIAAPPELTRRERGDLAIQARSLFKRYCSECHQSGSDHRGRLTVLEHDTLISKKLPLPFVQPLAVPQSLILEYLKEGSMPPAGKPRPTPQEIGILEQWIRAEAPSYPKAFDEATTLDRILTDVKALPAEDVRFYRYLSLAHLVKENEVPNLAIAENQLKRALLAATLNPKFIAEPVDSTATLFRLDLRLAQWHTRDLFDSFIMMNTAGVASFTPFDLILLEYPHTVLLPENHPLQAAFLKPTQQLVPIPYLQADWLSQVLTRESQLAQELLSLKQFAEQLVQNKSARPEGPEPRPFHEAKPLNFAIPSNAKLWPPLGGMLHTTIAAVRPPFQFQADFVNSKAEAISSVAVNEPFKLRLKCDATVKFLVLNFQPDGEIRLQEIGGSDEVEAAKTRIATPKNSAVKPPAFSIASIDSGAKSALEHFVVFAAKKDIPVPQIVRSRHGKNMIWRFSFPSDPTFDATEVVRIHLPLTVTDKK